MRAIREWWRRRVFWHRFTHGKCTSCGVFRPLQGATVCRVCFEETLRRARRERAA